MDPVGFWLLWQRRWVVGVLVVRDIWRFACFQNIIGRRVAVGVVRVWCRRGGVAGAAVGGKGVGEGHCAYAGFELSKVNARWWWSEGWQCFYVGWWVQWFVVRLVK